jgi:hypothetical protein
MTFTRRCRALTVLVSVWALLFAQGAVAGYVCPDSGKAVQVAEMARAQMPCAESMSTAMDDAQPGLCHAHCQEAGQSADHYQTPAFAALDDLGSTLLRPRFVHFLSGPSVQAPLLRHATAPPLAIRHCCLRI